MAAGGKLVRQDDSGIWLYLTLAAKKAGIGKDELMRRAGAGELAYRDDLPGKHWWFREPDIAVLAKAKIEAEWNKAPKPKRPKTEKALAKEIGARLAKAAPSNGGVMASHAERLTLPRDERIPKGQR
ncbi:MAG: hypothetical protein GW858_08255 [Sphingomonadales bacterium]|nr:hypothetical protein [Sphingomonadales bacterium]NCQ21019.1 hypothetical protein [Sphingomonadales bacterium]NCT03808.1 hypothetical protein [Sphingomonadales bacterium]